MTESDILAMLNEQGFDFRANVPLLIDLGMRLLSAILILIAGWVLGKWASGRIKQFKKVDETLTGFMAGFVRYAILAIAIVTILGQFGVQTASLIAVLGAAGLAIGLAVQGTLSNVAAGAMLLVLRPFKVGDYITAGNIGGTVKALGLFGTELATPDNVYLYVPNSQIFNKDISNFSRNPIRRQDIRVGISYEDDISKAFKIIHGVLAKEERILHDLEDKKPNVMVDAMGASSIDLIVRFWSKREDYWALRWDTTKAVKEALDKGGITIPFPIRTIKFEGDNPAPQQMAKKPAAKKKAA